MACSPCARRLRAQSGIRSGSFAVSACESVFRIFGVTAARPFPSIGRMNHDAYRSGAPSLHDDWERRLANDSNLHIGRDEPLDYVTHILLWLVVTALVVLLVLARPFAAA